MGIPLWTREQVANRILAGENLVIDVNGFHPINALFCQCDKIHVSGTRTQQLLRSELFGATTLDPRTCCTLRVLEHYHIMTLQSKVNQYDYYKSLEKLTDNTGLTMHYDRLKAFLRIVREYRHLKMLKRAGRGHETGGIPATRPGDLCVLCPACPRPGVNLPDNWRNAPENQRYIYSMFIAIDANFRLRRRAISSDARDPPLASGLGYFVEDEAYRAHLAEYANQEEISNCTNHSAVAQANKKTYKGYATTGVGMACCSRHGFVLPNGVGDLQRGERYCNMDFIWLSVLKLLSMDLDKTLSYDIICQWSKHLEQRAANFPQRLFTDVVLNNVRYIIPKYHFRAHKEEGHNIFSLNLLPGVGRTDGEEIERNWSRHNATSASTREMGPGARFDTLEDHFGWANWQKTVVLGVLLCDRLRRAIAERAHYQQLYDDFVSGIPKEKAAEWIKQVIAWERDCSQPDPYYIEPTGMTEADIRLKLAQEDDEEAACGHLSLHSITPAVMLMELLDIEHQQRKFCSQHPRGRGGTAAQSATVIEKRTALRRRLANIRAVQAIYIPCAPALVATYEQGLKTKGLSTEFIEEQPLFLPSGIDADALERCEPGLADIENRLREGQLRDSLDKLRVQLHIKARMLKFKADNVRNQGANTQANKRLQDNQAKIKALADKYRAARKAKLALAGSGGWEYEWRDLKHGDERCMTEDDPTMDRAASEGRKAVSWIWIAAGTRREGEKTADIPGIDDAIRIEFLRARARAQRFVEEVNILVEEQRRVLVSLRANTAMWDRREEAARSIECPITREGAAAYATGQAALQRDLAMKFTEMWSNQYSLPSARVEAQEPTDKKEDDGELMFGYDDDSDEDVENEDVHASDDEL
ncbi:hypothetical protein NM688_g4347 [Phlebia brevispora]|uniref:Uncharacterized protein n=1 Tax=Phlebia brevispora TaxID=194682 RepID=A0ACC1T3K1_9APHY|nr:hypothetical protein NM688_g4347 [Phlebia brevispora]